MSRIYAQNETHELDWTHLPFVAGVAAVPAGTDTSYFAAAARHYTVDGSKNHLEVWDAMSVAQLDVLYAYLGGTVSADDSKYAKVRKIEALISTKFIAAVTVVSAAATAGSGKTKITITSPGDYDYYFKSAATTAPAPYFGDEVDTTWKKLTLAEGVADEVVPNAATDDKCSIVRVNDAGVIIGIGTDDLALKS